MNSIIGACEHVHFSHATQLFKRLWWVAKIHISHSTIRSTVSHSDSLFTLRFKIWNKILRTKCEVTHFLLTEYQKASIFRLLRILRKYFHVFSVKCVRSEKIAESTRPRLKFILRHIVWSRRQNDFSLCITQHTKISLFVEKHSLLYYREWFKAN